MGRACGVHKELGAVASPRPKIKGCRHSDHLRAMGITVSRGQDHDITGWCRDQEGQEAVKVTAGSTLTPPQVDNGTLQNSGG